MGEEQPSHEYYYVVYLPSKIEVPEDKVKIALHIYDPSEAYTSKPHFGVVLKMEGRPEVYPIRTVKSGKELIYTFNIESKGVYKGLWRSPFESLRTEDLQALAKRYNIAGRSKMIKEELISSLAPQVGDLSQEGLKKAVEESKTLQTSSSEPR